MSAQVTHPDENTEIATFSKSKYRVIMRKDLCIGAASCAAIAGNTFEMNDNNIAIIKEGEWDEDDLILAAAQSCPVLAIIIEDIQTGERIFPVE